MTARLDAPAPAGHGERLGTLAAALRTLPDKPEESAASTLAALWRSAAGAPCSARLAGQGALPALDAAGLDRLDGLIARRLAGEPLAHLVGRQRFMELEMLAGPEALIPRAETELLGRAAVAALRELVAAPREAPPVVVDVCTGSGNLAIALAAHVPGARVLASDLSAEAIGLARRNAAFVGVADCVAFRIGDLLQPVSAEFAGAVDLLVCNPPYISSGRVDALPVETGVHEPRLAFDGGPLGIRILGRLISEAPSLLRPGGRLLMEVGAGQGRGVRARLAASGAFDDLVEVADAEGVVRVLGARRVP